MTTLVDDPPETTTSSPAQRLRGTMAAVALHFTWFGVRKSLNPEQKAQAADAFGAEGSYLSAGKKLILDGLVAAGVVGGDGWKHIRCWSDYWMLAASKPLHNGQPGCIVTISDDDATVIMGGG